MLNFYEYYIIKINSYVNFIQLFYYYCFFRFNNLFLLKKELLPDRIDWIIRYYYGYFISKFLFPCIFPNTFEANEIIPNIWLGNLKSGINYNELKNHNIKRIVIVILGAQPRYPNNFDYMVLPVRDISTENIGIHFHKAHKFIDEGVKQGEGVLIHCVAGISRSATIVISYLMKTLNLTYQEAEMKTKSKRPFIRVNDGFREILLNFEKSKLNK